MPFCHRVRVYIRVHIYTMFPIREKRFDYVEVTFHIPGASGASGSKYLKKFKKIMGKKKKPKPSS